MLLRICTEYGNEYNVILNATKSKKLMLNNHGNNPSIYNTTLNFMGVNIDVVA